MTGAVSPRSTVPGRGGYIFAQSGYTGGFDPDTGTLIFYLKYIGYENNLQSVGFTVSRPMQFGENLNINDLAIKRLTRGQKLISKRITNKILTGFVFTFRGLNEADKTNFETMQRDSVGMAFAVRNHWGEIFTGFLKTVEVKIVTEGRTCQYNVSLEMLGNSTFTNAI